MMQNELDQCGPGFSAALAALTYAAAASQTNRRLLGNRYVYRCHPTLDEEILLGPSKVTPLLTAISHVSPNPTHPHVFLQGAISQVQDTTVTTIYGPTQGNIRTQKCLFK